MIHSVGFLGRLLALLLKTGLPYIKNVMIPLAKSVFIPLGLTAAAFNNTTTISNDKIGDIIKIVKSLEDSGLLLKGVTETVQNEVKEQKGGFLSISLGRLGANLLGNLLAGKGIYRAGKGKGINRAGEGIVRASHGNKMDFQYRLIL